MNDGRGRQNSNSPSLDCRLRDNTIKMWDRATLSCLRVLNGHTGSVLCLQYDDKVIISGSSDSTVRRTKEMQSCHLDGKTPVTTLQAVPTA